MSLSNPICTSLSVREFEIFKNIQINLKEIGFFLRGPEAKGVGDLRGRTWKMNSSTVQTNSIVIKSEKCIFYNYLDVSQGPVWSTASPNQCLLLSCSNFQVWNWKGRLENSETSDRLSQREGCYYSARRYTIPTLLSLISYTFIMLKQSTTVLPVILWKLFQ